MKEMKRKKVAKLLKKRDRRQYWLWVTKPSYYLDENGEERKDLEPESGYEPEGWWTCHKDTRKGDLILLWRTKPKSDIRYLIQAKSDAYSLKDDDYASEYGWDYGCDYILLYKFNDSLKIGEIRADPYLEDWKPLGGRFQRRAWKIETENWKELNRLISEKNPAYRKLIEELEKEPIWKSILLEEQIERALVDENFKMLRRFGYELELYEDRKRQIKGKQLVCMGFGGRIDLLCFDRKRQHYVVIELKNTRANTNTLGQILKYIGWVEKRIANNIPVIGLVISRGCDAGFDFALEAMKERIYKLDIMELGFH